MRLFAWLIALVLVATVALAQDVPNNNHRFFVDPNNILSTKQQNLLNEKLANIEKNVPDHPQVLALIINSLKDSNIEEYSMAVFDKWKPGIKDVDNGLLLVVSIKDHKYAIKTGRGTEGRITDLETNQIYHDMEPEFKKHNWFKAVSIYADEVNAKLAGTTDLAEQKKPEPTGIFHIIFMVVFWAFWIGVIGFILIVVIAAAKSKKPTYGPKYTSQSNTYSSSNNDSTDSFTSGAILGSILSGSSKSDDSPSSSYDAGGGDSAGGGSSGSWDD